MEHRFRAAGCDSEHDAHILRATVNGGAVEIAGGVHGQACSRMLAVTPSGEGMEHGFGAAMRNLEHYAEPVRSALSCRAVKIAGRVHDQTCLRKRAVTPSGERMEHGF